MNEPREGRRLFHAESNVRRPLLPGFVRHDSVFVARLWDASPRKNALLPVRLEGEREEDKKKKETNRLSELAVFEAFL